MSYGANYTDFETLSAIEGLQQAVQQHDSPDFGTAQTRLSNPLLRVVPIRTQGTTQSGGLLPTAKVAPLTGGGRYITLSASGAVNNYQSLDFQHPDACQYMDETTGNIIYQSTESLQENYHQQNSFYPNDNSSGISQGIFIQHQPTHSSSGAAGTQLVSVGQRAPPASLKWLLENVEEAEGVSLPRFILYGHYVRHCEQIRQEPMNQASFGKLIRSVFTGIKGRRLGARGKSKYHYQGIRIKPTSKLNRCEYNIAEDYESTSTSEVRGGGGGSELTFKEKQSTAYNVNPDDLGDYFKDTLVTMPVFGKIHLEAGELLPEGVTEKHLTAFEELYTEHCEAIITSVIGLQFDDIEAFWKTFWRSNDQSLYEIERALPRKALYALSTMSSVQKYTAKSDCIFYQLLIEILIPDVLKPIPPALTSMVRNFARNTEDILRKSMPEVCNKMVESKVSAVKAFALILKRYTALNHLAQAARAVLQNPTQVTQMLSDLNRVDFNNIQEQGHWICGCTLELVSEVEMGLKTTLERQSSLEEWAGWLEGVVDHVLKPVEGRPNFDAFACKFLLNWSFYCLLVIRDLTLRSAASFGSFHLIHLLFDEYMFYLIERKVAEVRGGTVVSVIANKKETDKNFQKLTNASKLDAFDFQTPIEIGRRGTTSGDHDEDDGRLNFPSVPVKQELASASSDAAMCMASRDFFANSDSSSATTAANSTATGSVPGSVKTPAGNLSIKKTADGRTIVIVPSIESRNFLAKLKTDTSK